MQFIWYNPDIDAYQKGTMKDYDVVITTSSNVDRFDILYEFSDTPEKLINKILQSLNTVRQLELAG
ncbi:hypothetical protein [Marinoscillum furvescens]|uniref:Uncharacterized protein n=1 Tax=Marinoscillum furvescens DSM 4134 TaxID=1122208 RepID=A0A3D9KY77_MARFU|nr:hypothetical protein [Marinoscillum furvescens]RED94359.1 hypothetical protein C7460_12146 [Marinoscillum furvescens DSM 4134]